MTMLTAAANGAVPNFFDDDVYDDDNLSMDFDSLWSMLGENPPSSQSGLENSPSSILNQVDPAEHVEIDEDLQIPSGLLDMRGASSLTPPSYLAEASDFKTLGSDCPFESAKMEPLQQSGSFIQYPGSLDSRGLPVPPNGYVPAETYGSYQVVSSVNQLDASLAQFEMADYSLTHDLVQPDINCQSEKSFTSREAYYDSGEGSMKASLSSELEDSPLDDDEFLDSLNEADDCSMLELLGINGTLDFSPGQHTFDTCDLSSVINHDEMLVNDGKSDEHSMQNSNLGTVVFEDVMSPNCDIDGLHGSKCSLPSSGSYFNRPDVKPSIAMASAEPPPYSMLNLKMKKGLVHVKGEKREELISAAGGWKSNAVATRPFMRNGSIRSLSATVPVPKKVQDAVKEEAVSEFNSVKRELVSAVGSWKSNGVATRPFMVNGSIRSHSATIVPVPKKEQDAVKEDSVSEFNSVKRARQGIHLQPFLQSAANESVCIKEELKKKSVFFKISGSLPLKVKCQEEFHATCVDVDDDDDDPDICIIEELSVPPRKNQTQAGLKTPVTVQETSLGPSPPINHLGLGGVKPKTNDERLIYRVALQDLSQPNLEASPPDGLLAVPLLKHQRIALSWMIRKETANVHCAGGILADDQGLGKTISTIALILKERSPSSRLSDVQRKQNETVMLDLDEDDASTECDMSKKVGESCPVIPSENSQCLDASVQTKVKPAAGTLIVCPTSVLRQWSDELNNKVTSQANLSVLVYHGANRTKDPFELAKYDVVLTTYSIVSMEVPKQPLVDESEDKTKRESHTSPVGLSTSKKRKYPPTSSKSSSKGKKGMDDELFESLARPLARVNWYRVVLDEAQSIKNFRTQAARACWGLRAKRRWCLSGTPIQNAIDDLYSYFRFLKYEPYSVYKTFCSMLKAPIQRNSTNGFKKLQAVLKTIMLRRTKGTFLDGQPIINLPPKTIELRKVDFTDEEREFYCKLEADSRAQFEEYAAAGTVKQNYVNILLMLLRLRQACDHRLLVRGYGLNAEWRSSLEKAKKLPQEQRLRLLNCLEASMAICLLCNDPPEDAVVTKCEHVFCNQCILEHLSGDDNQCPATKCKARLDLSAVFSRATLKVSLLDQPLEERSNNNASCSMSAEALDCSSGAYGSSDAKAVESIDSSKIKAALEVIQSLCKPQEVACSQRNLSDDMPGEFCSDNKANECSVQGEKAIVFSQWTRMLDLLEDCLKNSNINYRRLDGTMTIGARDKAVKDFNSLPEVSVVIMSLKAASLGLNMVAACHVLLLDLWWNPTTEDQAVDRAHRIGQTRPVKVLRLTVKDTVEDRILALQQKKRAMVSAAFGEDATGSRQTRLTVDDLKYLFQV